MHMPVSTLCTLALETQFANSLSFYHRQLVVVVCTLEVGLIRFVNN